MSVAARIGRETTVQLFGLLIVAADRLLVAGVLVRLWDVSDFSGYAIATAAAGLISLCDFGVNLYFANRVMVLVQRGRTRAARTLARAGNALMLGASATGTVLVLGGLLAFGTGNRELPLTPALWFAAAAFSLAAMVRASAAIQMSVYRAHEQYARQTLLGLAVDSGRIIATVIAVLTGGGLIWVGAAQLAVAIVGYGYILWFESGRRFPAMHYRFGPMPRRERRVAFTISLGFWLQSAPSTLVTFFPVFLMNLSSATAVALAQFVLMRTIGNFVRTGLQPFALVFGQEAARRHMIGDAKGLATVYRESTYLIGAVGAVAGGLLIALGAPLFALWTGKNALYAAPLLWLAVAPVLLLPTLTMAQAYLATINAPWTMALGRAIQIPLTLLLFVTLPVHDDALRMMAALAVAELAGLGVPVTLRIFREVPGAGAAFHLSATLRLALTLAATIGAASVAIRALPLGPLIQVGVGALAGGAVGGAAILIAGLTGRRRHQLALALRRRLRVQ